MNAPLVTTKIRLPPLPWPYVPRARLREKIRQGHSVRLVLVSAPAGYGKSSILIDSCHALLTDGVKVVWYALDEGDNDPARFAAHLLEASRQTLDPADASHLAHDPTADIDGLIADLINAFAASSGHFALALDDYHTITEPAIHHGLGLLLEHLPSNVQIILGSRANPPIQLSRLRARGQMIELRAADLRFTRDEIAALYQQALGIQPSAQSLDRIEAVSEGWAAALRLMILALDAASEADDDAIQASLARFALGDQHVFDYFADEVFDQQPAHIQQFLLATSIAARLTPDMGAYLSGEQNATLILDQLSRAGLFVIRLAPEEPIYRYHHLAGEFLRRRLALYAPEQLAALHVQAARWHADFGNIIDAVDHALAAQARDYAAWLIETRAWLKVNEQGEAVTERIWRQSFTTDDLLQHPRLALYFSRAYYFGGDSARAHEHLDLAERELETLTLPEHERAELWAELLGRRAALAAFAGQVTSGQALIDRARAWFASLDDGAAQPHAIPPAHIQVTLDFTQGLLHWIADQHTQAKPWFESAVGVGMQAHNPHMVLGISLYLDAVDHDACRLAEIETRCESLLKLFPPQMAAVSSPMIPLARLLYERNDLQAAQRKMQEALQLARRGRVQINLWHLHRLRARLLTATGRFEDAYAAIDQAENVYAGFDSPIANMQAAADRTRTALAAGDLASAQAWAQAHLDAPPREFSSADEDLLLACVWIAAGDAARALPLLDRICAAAEADGRTRHVIEAEIGRALAHHAQHKPDRALHALAQALKRAAPARLVRTFLDHGAPLLVLVRLAVERQIERDYAERLLAAASAAPHLEAAPPTLSERELEVLGLLAEGATNQDIADRLVISLGTAKAHLNHIMTKLDARNRTEAVVKARAAHLIQL